MLEPVLQTGNAVDGILSTEYSLILVECFTLVCLSAPVDGQHSGHKHEPYKLKKTSEITR